MISIKTIASGSSGNCYRINDGTTVLMIECGISFKKIREAFDFKLSQVSGCIISHSHKDHCKAASDLMKNGVDCYMSQQTAERIGCLSHHRSKQIESKKQFQIGSFHILPFDVQHDVETFGFLLQSGTEKLLFATDTYYLKYKFAGLTHIMIECNYSSEILEENVLKGSVSRGMRDRLLESHFELENVKEFFYANDLSAVQEIHLLHISKGNGDAQFFKKEIQAVTGKPIYVIN